MRNQSLSFRGALFARTRNPDTVVMAGFRVHAKTRVPE
jgi:hypothetical protein